MPPPDGAKAAAADAPHGSPGSRTGPAAGGPYTYGNEDFGSLLRDVLRGLMGGPQGGCGLRGRAWGVGHGGWGMGSRAL